MYFEILEYLRENEYISGEMIAQELNISRVAVWKQVQRLKKLGYVIISDQNLGYCLTSRSDILLPQELQRGLSTHYIGKEIFYFSETESTNLIAKEKIISKKEVIKEGTVIIAEKQKAGKGRLGRQWFSPRGGIWLTIILYPPLSPAYIPRITLMTAVTVVKAVKEYTSITLEIKWPNDLINKEKKIGGILTEMNAELDRINWVIVGLGLNVNIDLQDFPPELKSKSNSLKEILGKNVSRVRLGQCILQEFEKYYERLKREEFLPILEEWKTYTSTLGKDVKLDIGGKIMQGKAIDVNSDGALILRKENGELTEIISGTLI